MKVSIKVPACGLPAQTRSASSYARLGHVPSVEAECAAESMVEPASPSLVAPLAVE